jgi:hypothetical protein
MLQNGQGAAVAIDIITSFGKGAISKAIRVRDQEREDCAQALFLPQY